MLADTLESPSTSPEPHTPPKTGPAPLETPRLEILSFEPLSFSHTVSDLFNVLEMAEQSKSFEVAAEPSAVSHSFEAPMDPSRFSNLRNVVLPEWTPEYCEEESEVSLGDILDPSIYESAPSEHLQGDHNADPCQSSPQHLRDDDEIVCISDFIPNAVELENTSVECVRRSTGRIYSMRKILQTRQSWSEVAILAEIKDVCASFFPLFHFVLEEGHYLYIITERYPSVTLADTIRTCGVFSSLDIFFYACEIITGLRSLHDAGIMHRNISPDTIIFDGEGHIILSGLEYGMFTNSRQLCLHESTSQESQLYQAPELLLGWNHDILVDSWSFGMVVYFMFHGKHAFSSEDEPNIDIDSLTSKIISEGLPNRTIRFINPIARDMILKCLERNPILRLSSRGVQSHPFFSNANWEKVKNRRIAVPASRQCRSTTGTSAKCIPKSDANPEHELTMPPLLGSPLVVTGDRTVDCTFLRELKHGIEQPEGHSGPSVPPSVLSRSAKQEATGFWSTLELDDRSSISSECSRFSDVKISFARAWNRRKERSLVYPHRLLTLSTASIHKRLRRRTKSAVTLKHATYAEPIPDLPLGLHQTGSGIGFNYKSPATASPGPISRVSESTIVPNACHGLFQCLGVSSFLSGAKHFADMLPNPFELVRSPVLASTDGLGTVFDISSRASIAQDAMKHEEPTPTATELGYVISSHQAQIEDIDIGAESCKPELTSPVESCLTTSSGTESKSVQTPATLVFQPHTPVGEDDVIEIKRSKEIHLNIEPKTTLRLVPRGAGLRLSWVVHNPT